MTLYQAGDTLTVTLIGKWRGLSATCLGPLAVGQTLWRVTHQDVYFVVIEHAGGATVMSKLEGRALADALHKLGVAPDAPLPE